MQSSIGDYETPHWADGYDHPVVVRSGGNKTIHSPDLSADEPEPVCPSAKDDTKWTVKEFTHVHGWWDCCGYGDCKHRLAAVVDEVVDDE